MSNNNNFSKKDRICHSLIEATLFKNLSVQFIDSLLENLKNFQNESGYDMMIDILFVKYLKAINFNSNNSEIKRYVESFKNNQKINSQYVIAFLCFSDSLNQFDFKRKIKEQSIKLIRNEMISINEINISTVISYYILNKFFCYFNFSRKIMNMSNNEYIPNDDYFLNEMKIDNDLKIYKNKHYDIINQKEKEDITNEYNRFKQNPDSYYSIDFWTSVNLYQIIDNYEIDVQDNPYLFNAAAILSYLNPLIKVNYNITNLKLPEKITFDLFDLLFYKLTLKQLLEIKAYSNEVKNLCSLIYLLILNQKTLKDLSIYKNSMNPNSYSILTFIFEKYVSNKSRYSSINSEIDIKNPDDFIKLRYIKLKDKYYYKNNILNSKNELLYLKQSNDFRCKCKTVEEYGLLKKTLVNSNDNVYKYVNNKYKEDFIRFVGTAINHLTGKKKYRAIEYFSLNQKNVELKIECIFSFIDSFDYIHAQNMLLDLNPTKELENSMKEKENLIKIKFLLKKIQPDDAYLIIKKFNLEDILNNEEKLAIYFNKSLDPINFRITRQYILNDSFCYFLDNNMKNKKINITYADEWASDEGGISKDWFTNVSKEIINTEIFVPVPNGDSLTFNHKKEDMMLYRFTGQFIATAFNNNRNINIKLASFIWKQMLGEEITLEDMKNYDVDLYESMKWITENDPSLLEMTFVDADENELCKNGGEITVTNENKLEFVKLMIEKKLIKENLETLEYLVNGFRDVINFNFITLFSSKNIQEIINGVEIIDVEDLKKNTICDKKYEKEFNDFFEIISKWPQEKLQKLLMFATGSSTIPFGGFKNLENNGGLFTLYFCKNDTMALPTSHTCFNKIEMPCYPSKKTLDDKLSLAIECDTFGFS